MENSAENAVKDAILEQMWEWKASNKSLDHENDAAVFAKIAVDVCKRVGVGRPPYDP